MHSQAYTKEANDDTVVIFRRFSSSMVMRLVIRMVVCTMASVSVLSGY